MKKLLSASLVAMGVLMFAGCDLVDSTSDTGNLDNNETVPDSVTIRIPLQSVSISNFEKDDAAQTMVTNYVATYDSVTHGYDILGINAATNDTTERYTMWYTTHGNLYAKVILDSSYAECSHIAMVEKWDGINYVGYKRWALPESNAQEPILLLERNKHKATTFARSLSFSDTTSNFILTDSITYTSYELSGNLPVQSITTYSYKSDRDTVKFTTSEQDGMIKIIPGYPRNGSDSCFISKEVDMYLDTYAYHGELKDYWSLGSDRLDNTYMWDMEPAPAGYQWTPSYRTIRVSSASLGYVGDKLWE